MSRLLQKIKSGDGLKNKHNDVGCDMRVENFNWCMIRFENGKYHTLVRGTNIFGGARFRRLLRGPSHAMIGITSGCFVT